MLKILTRIITKEINQRFSAKTIKNKTSKPKKPKTASNGNAKSKEKNNGLFSQPINNI